MTVSFNRNFGAWQVDGRGAYDTKEAALAAEGSGDNGAGGIVHGPDTLEFGTGGIQVSGGPDPGDVPNPSNPGGISNNELIKRQRALDDPSTANTNLNRTNTNRTTTVGADGTRVAIDPTIQADPYQSYRAPGTIGSTRRDGSGNIVRIRGDRYEGESDDITAQMGTIGPNGVFTPPAPPAQGNNAAVPGGGVANSIGVGLDETTNAGLDRLDETITNPAIGDEAPVINREKIDTILNSLSGYENKIADLADDNTGLSVAESQLKKATELANIQSGIDTEASQRSALGMARSARSRGDRGLLERQAVGEASFIGQEAARTNALRQAEQEGNLAELRAQEADYDRRFKLEALGKASDLGLNRSALEVDISKADLDSATNWVNNQFSQLGIDKQINQAEAEQLLGFTRDMAAIQQQYDALAVQDQNEADALLMQKYGIDQGTMVALKKIKEDGKFQWDQVLAGIAGGVGSGLTGGISRLIGGSDK